MRFLLVVIIILLLAYKFWPQQPALTAEESIIGPQLESMKKAEQIDQQYLDALENTNKRIERDSDGG